MTSAAAGDELSRGPNSLPSLSVMFFGAAESGMYGDEYSTIRSAALAADQLGFEAIWLPERHFNAFGGLFPNPAALAANLACVTHSCALRAGSVVGPLHDVLRIAEDWALVDHLTGGDRIGISIGSGWNANDFVLAPGMYNDRAEHALTTVDDLRHLWAGEHIRRINGAGQDVAVLTYPRPVSAELPLWLTSSGNPATFRSAGRRGTHVLTHLLSQNIDQLAENVELYRQARVDAGHGSESGRVTLMLHTLVTETDQDAWASARVHLQSYLRTALNLELEAAHGGGSVSGRNMSLPALSPSVVDELIEDRTRRFYDEASLLGTATKCQGVMERLARIGIDEIACLVDFGVDEQHLLAGLERLSNTMHLQQDRMLTRVQRA